MFLLNKIDLKIKILFHMILSSDSFSTDHLSVFFISILTFCRSIMAKVKVTLKRSLIGRPETQRKTVRALGLRKINAVVELPDNPAIRGQLHKVEHLIAIEEIAD